MAIGEVIKEEENNVQGIPGAFAKEYLLFSLTIALLYLSCTSQNYNAVIYSQTCHCHCCGGNINSNSEVGKTIKRIYNSFNPCIGLSVSYI